MKEAPEGAWAAGWDPFVAAGVSGRGGATGSTSLATNAAGRDHPRCRVG